MHLKCLKCRYRSTSTGSCDYILIMGERRGCEAGKHCRRYIPADLLVKGERRGSGDPSLMFRRGAVESLCRPSSLPYRESLENQAVHYR